MNISVSKHHVQMRNAASCMTNLLSRPGLTGAPALKRFVFSIYMFPIHTESTEFLIGEECEQDLLEYLRRMGSAALIRWCILVSFLSNTFSLLRVLKRRPTGSIVYLKGTATYISLYQRPSLLIAPFC